MKIAFARSGALLDFSLNPFGVVAHHIRMGGRGSVAGSGGPWLYKLVGPEEGIAMIPELFPDLKLYPGPEADAADLDPEHKAQFQALGIPVTKRVRNVLRAWRDAAGEDWRTFDI